MGRGLGIEAVKRFQHLVAWGLQRVGPEIDGSALRQRRPLLRRARAEGTLELASEPFGVIASDVSRRVGRQVALKPSALGF
jgi:hypothetical protein